MTTITEIARELRLLPPEKQQQIVAEFVARYTKEDTRGCDTPPSPRS